jgi:hypothetical protein
VTKIEVPKSRAPLIILIVLVVLAVLSGLALAAYRFVLAPRLGAVTRPSREVGSASVAMVE